MSSLSPYKKSGEKQELILAIPTLFKVNLFDLFPVEKWIKGENKRRKFVDKQVKPYQNKQHRLTR
ncbi:DUF7709 family protein [Acinetobacter ursingii]